MLPYSGKHAIKFKQKYSYAMLVNVIKMAVTLSFGPKSFLKTGKNGVKNIPMGKKETLGFLSIAPLYMTLSLHAGIDNAILSSVESNAAMRLLFYNIGFLCEPYAIIPLEKMAASAPDPQGCRNAIAQWYRTHPQEKKFAHRHLHLQQSYRFERRKEGCILYANGPESYSEMLLLYGLAVIAPDFDDKEWNGRLRRAQRGAERNKSGLHDSAIRESCFEKVE